MAELHSICGLFNEEFSGIKPFGGYLLVEGDKINDGFLSDIYGPSQVSEGVIDKERLEFLKVYIQGDQASYQRGRPISYKFKFENGIWKGEYVTSQPSKTGRAVCKTDLCFKDLEFKVVNYSGDPEGWAKFMIDGMIASGHLEKFKDNKTGEEMIRPVDK